MTTFQINEHPPVTTSAVAYALTNTKSDIIAFAKAQSDFLREKIYNPIAAQFKSELAGRVIALLTSILEVPIQFVISTAIVLLFTSVVFSIHLFSQTQFNGNNVERMPEHNSEESLTIQLKDVDGEVVVSQPQLIPTANANDVLPQSQLDAQWWNAYISQDIDEDDVSISTEAQVNELLTPLPEFLSLEDDQIPSDLSFSFENEEPVAKQTQTEDLFDRLLEKGVEISKNDVVANVSGRKKIKLKRSPKIVKEKNEFENLLKTKKSKAVEKQVNIQESAKQLAAKREEKLTKGKTEWLELDAKEKKALEEMDLQAKFDATVLEREKGVFDFENRNKNTLAQPVIEAAKPAKTTVEDILKLHTEFDDYLEKTAVKPNPKSVQKPEEGNEAVTARFEQRKKLLEQAKAERELLERYNRHMNLAKNGDVDKLPFSWHAQRDFFKLHETT